MGLQPARVCLGPRSLCVGHAAALLSRASSSARSCCCCCELVTSCSLLATSYGLLLAAYLELGEELLLLRELAAARQYLE